MRETVCMMNCGKSSAHRYVERIAKTGDVPRKNYVRSPTVITDEFKQTLVTLVESERSNPYGCPGFKWVYKRLDRNLYPCSLMTVKRALKKMGYIMKTMVRKLLHKENRLRLAEYFEGLAESQLQNVIWTDEKLFRCSTHCKKITYLAHKDDPDREPPPQTDRWYGGKGVLVWMGVSLKWGIPQPHCFHEFGEHDTVSNDSFFKVMSKRSGFFNWVRRRPCSIIVLDNAPGHGQARRAGLQAGLNIIDWHSK